MCRSRDRWASAVGRDSKRESKFFPLFYNAPQRECVCVCASDRLSRLTSLQAALDTLEATRLDDISGKLRSAAEAIASYERERRINPGAV